MHAAEQLEVRMIMSEPSRAAWYGRRVDSAMGGGYEVRVRDEYREATVQGAQAGTREGWDSRTVYVENIPPQYRSLAGIYHFVSSLLHLEGSVIRPWRLQSISLPRHHQDRPNDQSKCKGFALVTLAEDDDVHALLTRWPWARKNLNSAPLEHEGTRNTERDEAIKFGFRVLEKTAWQHLNEEYIAYRQRLLDEITREESAAQVEYTTSTAADEPEAFPANQEDPTPSMDPNAPFPQNCLVFVRNVHPETNKTTLRKLLSRAFEASGAETSSEAIDYVDFNKGMTSCYLRLSTPHIAQHIVLYYTQNQVAQSGGLDGDGGSPSAATKAITMELVTGEREELYWNKVPEKVRRQAVAKAAGFCTMDAQPEPSSTKNFTGSKRKRRR